MGEYKEIPISAARHVAEEFDKDQVIIITWDRAFRRQHVTTYGTSKLDSIQAVTAGNLLKHHLGWPHYLTNDMPAWWHKERNALLDACKLALVEMQNADATLEAEAIAKGDYGIYSPFFSKEIRHLKAVITRAESDQK